MEENNDDTYFQSILLWQLVSPLKKAKHQKYSAVHVAVFQILTHQFFRLKFVNQYQTSLMTAMEWWEVSSTSKTRRELSLAEEEIIKIAQKKNASHWHLWVEFGRNSV